jgi:hypothetical protein
MPTTPQPTFAEQVRWPLIVLALLVGHVLLMLLGLTVSLAFPASLAEPPATTAPHHKP